MNICTHLLHLFSPHELASTIAHAHTRRVTTISRFQLFDFRFPFQFSVSVFRFSFPFQLSVSSVSTCPFFRGGWAAPAAYCISVVACSFPMTSTISNLKYLDVVCPRFALTRSASLRHDCSFLVHCNRSSSTAGV